MKLSNKGYENLRFCIFNILFHSFFLPTTMSTTSFFLPTTCKNVTKRQSIVRRLKLPFFPRANFAKNYQNCLTHNQKLNTLLNWIKFTFIFKMKFFRWNLYLPKAIHRYAWRNLTLCLSKLNFLNICPGRNKDLLKYL